MPTDTTTEGRPEVAERPLEADVVRALVDQHRAFLAFLERRVGARGRALERLAHDLEAREEPSPDLRDVVCRCVGELAGTLKPEYADALQKVEVEGLSVQAFAEAAGITPNNAAVRVQRSGFTPAQPQVVFSHAHFWSLSMGASSARRAPSRALVPEDAGVARALHPSCAVASGAAAAGQAG